MEISHSRDPEISYTLPLSMSVLRQLDQELLPVCHHFFILLYIYIYIKSRDSKHGVFVAWSGTRNMDAHSLIRVPHGCLAIFSGRSSNRFAGLSHLEKTIVLNRGPVAVVVRSSRLLM